VAIGGFSTHDASIGLFRQHADRDDRGGLHAALRGELRAALRGVAQQEPADAIYCQRQRVRFYLFLLALHRHRHRRALLPDTYIDWGESFTKGLFQVVSIGTTTGFTTAQFYYWPPFIEILLLFLAFVGGCAGSTGGGIKVIRFCC
jgi:trk system potassium uptake protein TrkH